MAEASPDLGFTRHAPAPADTAPSPVPGPAATRRPLNARSPLVLIVDDDDVSSFVIQHTLRAAGVQTATATSVTAAVAFMRSRRPDLVLLDVRLPDGSGFDVCRHLQDDPVGSHTPVLFISGVHDVETKVQAFESGGVDYITKPVSPAEVTARVFTHLRLKHAYEQLAALQAERIQRLATAQEAFMPTPESVPGVPFRVARRQVLQAGGDFYDVIPVGPDMVDFVVADASGHDLAASYWTAALKTLLSEYATPTNTPRNILQQVNDALQRILPDEVYFTMLYVRLNRRARRLTVVNAAHPPAVIVPAAGDPSVIDQDGDVLGAFPDAVFGMTRVDLKPGDRLLAFTDGLIEVGGTREDGMARLRRSLVESRGLGLADLVERVVTDTLAGLPATDDIVVLGAEL